MSLRLLIQATRPTMSCSTHGGEGGKGKGARLSLAGQGQRSVTHTRHSAAGGTPTSAPPPNVAAMTHANTGRLDCQPAADDVEEGRRVGGGSCSTSPSNVVVLPLHPPACPPQDGQLQPLASPPYSPPPPPPPSLSLCLSLSPGTSCSCPRTRSTGPTARTGGGPRWTAWCRTRGGR